MREIKFRAWDKEDERMYQPCFAEIEKDGSYNVWFNRCWGEGDNDTTNEKDYSGDAVLMQFTGLKDKNGKEIYEGDIVKCNAAPYYETKDFKKFKVSGKVVFDRSMSFRIEDIDRHRCFYLNDCLDIEIIGNIYENPELLKGGIQ